MNELVIDYQQLLVLGNTVTLSWIVNDDCSDDFRVLGYILSSGEPVLSPNHIISVGQERSVTIEQTTSDISYKLVAQNLNGAKCPSNRNIYYNFDGTFLC